MSLTSTPIVLKWWHVISFLVVLIFSGGIFYDNTQNSTQELKSKYEDLAPRLDRIELRLNTIEVLTGKSSVEIEGVKSQMNDIKDLQKEELKAIYKIR